MTHDQSCNHLPEPTGFAGDKPRMPDDPTLRNVATTPPGVIAQWLKKTIHRMPQCILKSPPMIPVLARNNIRTFTVDSVDTDVVAVTEGPDEVHIAMCFELREKPVSPNRSGNTIRGRVTVVLMRRGLMAFDVTCAEVNPDGAVSAPDWRRTLPRAR